jgi:tetratricopeptide (TPR) repeat protein
MDKTLDIRRDLLLCLFLVVATLAVYWQVRNHDFVNYDDDHYITENRHVRAGLTKEGIIWAFTTTHASNWHPLTWLSHMLDCQIYGLNPGWHHVTSLLFHIANTLLLFVILKQMTGARWQSAFVAALFALHPLHVQSVAWAAERKDVLSTFFWMLTMGSYVRYVESPGAGRYLLVLLFFALGLMSKPMIVTLPFVLLLLGYGEPQSQEAMNLSNKNAVLLHLVWEKAPFFLLAAVSCAVTFLAQQSGGALAPVPLDVRMANTLVSYVSYVGKMIWPHHLAVLYPHPGMLPMWQASAAGLLLLFISVLALRVVRGHPYVAFGWLWYIGTLVPVIGLVQVGSQAMADRYTYVPFIGLFIIIAWGIPQLVIGWHHINIVLATIATAILFIFMTTTFLQVRYWKNSVTLLEHSLEVTSDNYILHNNLGNALQNQTRTEEAIDHYFEALRIKPDFEMAHYNVGIALDKQGHRQEAIDHYFEALRIKPDYAEAHSNLGIALMHQNRADEAMTHLREALRLNPDSAEAHNNLGFALVQQGRLERAISHYSKAIKIKPDYAKAHYNLANAYVKKDRLDDAIAEYRKTLDIEPKFKDVYYKLGSTFGAQGKLRNAIRNYREAIHNHPDNPKPYNNLAWIYATSPTESIRNGKEAAALATIASELTEFKNVQVLDTLAAAYAEQGDFKKAMEYQRRAIALASPQRAKELQKRLDLYKAGYAYRDQ